MEMFHRASLKLGLDQAVLHGVADDANEAIKDAKTGVEQGQGQGQGLTPSDAAAQAAAGGVGLSEAAKVLTATSREVLTVGPESSKHGGRSKSRKPTAKELMEVLQYGAYDLFREEREGKSDTMSKAFCEADIDQILNTRTKRKTVEGGNKESKRLLGNTFAKASFVSAEGSNELDVDDPNFWKKVIGDNSRLLKIENEESSSSNSKRLIDGSGGNVQQLPLDQYGMYADLGNGVRLPAGGDGGTFLERGRWCQSITWNAQRRDRVVAALLTHGLDQPQLIAVEAGLVSSVREAVEARTIGAARAFSRGLVAMLMERVAEFGETETQDERKKESGQKALIHK
jgi:hypothetical protein